MVHANFEAKDDKGKTPLHTASDNIYFEVVKYLIKQFHANVEVIDDKGRTSLHVASKFISVLFF